MIRPKPLMTTGRGVFVLLCLVGITAASCGSSSHSTAGSSTGGSSSGGDSSPIKIAVPEPFSGDTAIFGQYVIDGIQFAEKQFGAKVGNHPIQLIKADTQCTPSVAVQAAQQILAQNPIAGVASACSGDTAAFAAAFAAQKIPLVSVNLLPTIAAQDPYIYLTQNGDLLNGKFAKYIAATGVKHIGVLHDTTAYGQGTASSMVAALKSNGLNPVVNLTFGAGDSDFSGQILAAKRAGVDAIYLEAYAPQIAHVIIQIRQLGVNVPIFTSEDGSETDSLQAGGASLNGVEFASPYLPGNGAAAQQYESTWQSLFGSAPPGTAGEIIFEGSYVLIAALHHAGANPTSASINAAIAATHLDSPSGVITFGSDHLRSDFSIQVGKIENGAITQVQQLP